MRAFLSILTAWVALCLTSATALAQSPVPIGNAACKTCHVKYEGHKVNVFHSDCLACHTPEAKHLAEGGKGTMQFPTADNCLSCHKNNDHKRMNWAFSEHKKANVQCQDCHGIHSPKKPKQFSLALWKTDQKSAVCMDCHQDVAARMNMSSHHPVKEGALSCVSCHDPHSGKQTSLRTKNDRCFECHQSLRGPKIFEHRPVTEDCGNCHNPHGSPNARLLTLSEPVLCLQCHAVTHSHRTSGSTGNVLRSSVLMKCSNCHGAIHGSHSQKLLRR